MNWTTASMDLNDDQTRTRNTDLNQFIVRGGKLLYKLTRLNTSIILMATVFSFYFSDLFLVKGLLHFMAPLFGLPSFSYVYYARPYHWSFMEGHSDHWNTYLSCTCCIRGDIPPQTTFPFVPCSLNSKPKLFITICYSSNHPRSRTRPKAQYIIWALDPTIASQNFGFFLSSEEKTGVLNF